MLSEPMISVFLLTYNHEKYIAKAIESVLMQVTEYSYEILIADDCSTDRTSELVNEYYKKYPDKIKLIKPKHNIGATNLHCRFLDIARGKYIAGLEGDDYWCDKYKLQKQVDFLENHKEYIACTHRVNVVNEDDDIIEEKNDYSKDTFWNYTGQRYAMQNFLEGKSPGHGNSLVYRNIFFGNQLLEAKKLLRCHRLIGDRTTNLIMAMNGDVFRLDDIMSCYRMVEKVGENNYQSTTRTVNKRAEEYEYICKLERLARKKDKNINMYEIKKDKLICAIVFMLNNPQWENLKVVWDMLKRSGYGWKYLRIFVLTVFQKLYYRYIVHDDRSVVIHG